jgi:hypothetical protein
MQKVFQNILIAIGILAFIALAIEIALSVGATLHSSTPVKIVNVHAGPYPLTVNLYKDPANAGFALPFSIVPQQSTHEKLTFDVSSIPTGDIPATQVHSSFSQDTSTGGVQGNAEITVQGSWVLHISVSGPAGQGMADVPITATAPPAIPDWLGWLIGFIPFYGLLIFLVMLRGRKKAREPLGETQLTA